MVPLNFKEILELIDKVADRGLSAIEIESAGVKVRIEGKRSEAFSYPSHLLAPSFSPSQPLLNLPLSTTQEAEQASSATRESQREDEVDTSWHILTSPIVGTFYRTPNPEAEMFVNIGDQVTKGKVLCIVEAMKLMNEIESDVDGVVMKIFPQNGQPIEYGEKLFAIKI